MNKRTFAVVFGAVAVAGVGASNLTACSGGFGGSGGGGIGGDTASSSSVSSSTSTSTSSSSSSSTSTSSSGMCNMALKCSEAITAGVGDPAMFCAGTPSEMLYKAFHDCTCTNKCMAECMASSVCVMPVKDPDALCNTCIQAMCKTEADNCANDN